MPAPAARLLSYRLHCLRTTLTRPCHCCALATCALGNDLLPFFQESLFAGVPEYFKLQKLAWEACVEHAMRSGKWRYQGRGAEGADRDWFLKNTKLYIWAAVYTNGTFHNPHQHEDSICSGVFYSKANEASSPIIFSDPRGTNIFSIVQQNVSAVLLLLPWSSFLHSLVNRSHHPLPQIAQSGLTDVKAKLATTAEPGAPFFHQYSLFPKSGDMVLFPSYLVHRVLPNPSPKGEASRIAFAFNLLGKFDCWLRSNV